MPRLRKPRHPPPLPPPPARSNVTPRPVPQPPDAPVRPQRARLPAGVPAGPLCAAHHQHKRLRRDRQRGEPPFRPRTAQLAPPPRARRGSAVAAGTPAPAPARPTHASRTQPPSPQPNPASPPAPSLPQMVYGGRPCGPAGQYIEWRSMALLKSDGSTACNAGPQGASNPMFDREWFGNCGGARQGRGVGFGRPRGLYFAAGARPARLRVGKDACSWAGNVYWERVHPVWFRCTLHTHLLSRTAPPPAPQCRRSGSRTRCHSASAAPAPAPRPPLRR